MINLLRAKVAYKAWFQGRVHRIKGTRFYNPATARMEICPGGEWHDGREGKWYDHGVLTQRAVLANAYAWLFTRMRMECREILLFIRSLFVRRKK